MTPSIDQTLHQFANVLPNWTLLPILSLLPYFGGFHRTLKRVQLANRGRLLLRTPCPVPFGTCICSNVETNLSWICHFHGLFEFWTSLGTSILLLPLVWGGVLLCFAVAVVWLLLGVGRFVSFYKENYFKCVSDHTSFWVQLKDWDPVNRLDYTIWKAVVTTTSRP